jgi:hypothetical protein
MNKYAKQLSDLADDAFMEYRTISGDIEKAMENVNQIKQEISKQGKRPVLIGKLAEAEETLKEARDKQRSFKINKVMQYERQANEINTAYEKYLESRYTVDSSQVDMATMALLSSGVCDVNDYERLYDEAEHAGNITMLRIISNRAYEAGKKSNNFDGVGTRLRTLKTRAKDFIDGGRGRLFSEVIAAFNRRLQNPELIKNNAWSENIIPALESLGNDAEGGEDNESGNAECL